MGETWDAVWNAAVDLGYISDGPFDDEDEDEEEDDSCTSDE